MRISTAAIAITACLVGPATAGITIAERAACTPDGYGVALVHYPYVLSHDWYCEIPERTGTGMTAFCANDGETPWRLTMDVTDDDVTIFGDVTYTLPLEPCPTPSN